MSSDIVHGSISQIAARDGSSLAIAFLDCDHIILVDTSGSMLENDSTGGRTRYDVACEEMRKLQRDMPGKIGIFSYSSDCFFCPGGVPDIQGTGTHMLGALQEVEGLDGTVKSFVVISDGYPDPGTESSILALAGRFSTPIHTIFAGPVEDTMGRKFMDELARAGRGKSAFSAKAAGLGESTMKLLR